jgi:hypothetical protein
MYTQTELDRYMSEIRSQVCSRCIERPPGGPPCAPLGKRCGIELNFPQLVEVVHTTKSKWMGPYIGHLHDDVCTHCAVRTTNQCPCPLDCLLLLAVEAIESVDERIVTEEFAAEHLS